MCDCDIISVIEFHSKCCKLPYLPEHYFYVVDELTFFFLYVYYFNLWLTMKLYLLLV